MARNVTQDKSLTVKGTEDAILHMNGEEEGEKSKEVLVCESESKNEDESDVIWSRFQRGKCRFQSNAGRGGYQSERPQANSRGGFKRKRGWFNCGKWDHFAADCPDDKDTDENKHSKKQK